MGRVLDLALTCSVEGCDHTPTRLTRRLFQDWTDRCRGHTFEGGSFNGWRWTVIANEARLFGMERARECRMNGQGCQPLRADRRHY